MASQISSGISKIDHEITQGPDGALRALDLWMMECASVRGPDFRRNTPAAMRLNAALERIMATGANPDYAPRSTTAMCVCAMKENVPAMRILHSAGASMGRVANSTALITALAHWSNGAVHFALASGADPNEPNASGTAPAHMALQTRNFAMLEELFSLGASLNPVSADNPHPLSEVVQIWCDEAMPESERANTIGRLIDVPGCDLDIDAPCAGRPGHQAILDGAGKRAPGLVARARQRHLDRQCASPRSGALASMRRI